MPGDSLIVLVLQRYYEGWEPPKDTGREWIKTLCPFHVESNPSASISFEHDAVNCFSCGEKGDALGIIMRKEGMNYLQAVEYAEEISEGSYRHVHSEPPRKRGRRVFGQEGSSGQERHREERKVPPWVRRRPFAGA